jgi:hypothetical protein
MKVTRYFEIVYTADRCYVNVKLDLPRMKRLFLELNAEGVVNALIDAKKLKLKRDVSVGVRLTREADASCALIYISVCRM